jgi:uncharacterized membrane protein YeiB
VVTIARLNGFRIVRDQWLAFTYIGAILLLVAHDRAWLRRLSPLAWAGRMALTNYMMQVVLLDVLFTPHGFGLKVPPIMVPIGALLLFGLQSALSRWWLSRHRLGPLEDLAVRRYWRGAAAAGSEAGTGVTVGALRRATTPLTLHDRPTPGGSATSSGDPPSDAISSIVPTSM